jgi:hypothetical protein
MKVRFLLDENLSPRLLPALRRYDATLDILRVGDEGAPPLGTSDSDILKYLESAQRVLITDNRSTMPAHVREHLSDGRHHWGVFRTRPRTTLYEIIEEMVLLWEASEAEEWVDWEDWIPL